MPKPSDAAAAVVEADKAVAEAVLPHEESLPVRLLEHVADLGDQPPMRILCASVIAVGLIGGDRRLMRTGVKMLVAHSFATLAKDFVKLRVDRTRPRSTKKPGKDAKPRSGRNPAKEETSFPSGHSAGAMAVASAFAREYPNQAIPAYLAGSALALAQIPRCAHYPSDVGVGSAIGLVSGVATDLVLGLAVPGLARTADDA